jgi:hypothetical protein
MPICAPLGGHVGQTFACSMIINSSFAPSSVFFLGTVICARGSNALMLLVVGFIFPVMSYLMKLFTRSVS